MKPQSKIFDAHFHIIDPAFPLIANHGFLPAPFTTKIYEIEAKKYNIAGGVIVSGSFQGFDQEYLFHALAQLGPNYVGVLNLSSHASDHDILLLHQNGIKGVRFNLYRGGSETVEKLLPFAKRINDLCGMHVELYISGEQIVHYFNLLSQLPKFSIDHLGLTETGAPELLKLVEKGVHVKATGFMRVNFDPLNRMKTIHAINPEALMFGTDLPGTRANRTFDITDLQLIQNHFSENDCHKIFHDNALKFYGIKIN